MKFKFYKIIRYGFLFPLDVIRSLPFLMLCLFFPTCDSFVLAKRLLILFLYKKPTSNRLSSLSRILMTTNYCNWKCIFSFFMFPELV